MEPVRFTTYDDIEIAANLYMPGRRGTWVPAVIVCHDFASNKEEHREFGEAASAAGFATLIMDLRGHGESGGEIDSNIFNDVAGALSYLQGRDDVNPLSIAIRGIGMGGWLAIHTSAHLKDITPVVAIAPVSEAQLTILMEEVAIVQRGHTSPLVAGVPPRANVNSTMKLIYRLDILKAARRINPRPFLLIHCEDDEVVPAHTSQQIYDEVREPKSLWLLPSCDHRFAQYDAETTHRTLDWLGVTRPSTGKLSSERMSGSG
jgi:cephalosporin-C deacetylase-like acetyl esterase